MEDHDEPDEGQDPGGPEEPQEPEEPEKTGRGRFRRASVHRAPRNAPANLYAIAPAFEALTKALRSPAMEAFGNLQYQSPAIEALSKALRSPAMEAIVESLAVAQPESPTRDSVDPELQETVNKALRAVLDSDADVLEQVESGTAPHIPEFDTDAAWEHVSLAAPDFTGPVDEALASSGLSHAQIRWIRRGVLLTIIQMFVVGTAFAGAIFTGPFALAAIAVIAYIADPKAATDVVMGWAGIREGQEHETTEEGEGHNPRN